MAPRLSFSRWYRLLCLSYSPVIPWCIQNLIFTFSLSNLFTQVSLLGLRSCNLIHFEPLVALDVHFEVCLGIFSLKKSPELGIPFTLDAQRSCLIQLKEALNIVSHTIVFDVFKHLVKVVIYIKGGDCKKLK